MHLVVLFGPPAVGKMSVGHELCRLTGYRLFRNHLTIEPLRRRSSPTCRKSVLLRCCELERHVMSTGIVPTPADAVLSGAQRQPG